MGRGTLIIFLKHIPNIIAFVSTYFSTYLLKIAQFCPSRVAQFGGGWGGGGGLPPTCPGTGPLKATLQIPGPAHLEKTREEEGRDTLPAAWCSCPCVSATVVSSGLQIPSAPGTHSIVPSHTDQQRCLSSGLVGDWGICSDCARLGASSCKTSSHPGCWVARRAFQPSGVLEQFTEVPTH